jgi:hypothetical protein
MALLFYRYGSRLSNIKILRTEGGIWSEEFMSEDLGEEDIVDLVLGFEAVATDGAVGGGNVLGDHGGTIIIDSP